VFAGGWTLEAAEAVANSKDPAAPPRSPAGAGRTAGLGEGRTPSERRGQVMKDEEIHPSEVLDTLGRLVVKSLVQVEMLPNAGVALYHLLETIRQYALEKLIVSGEADVVRRRHAVYFLKVWQKNGEQFALHGTLAPPWYDFKDMEMANLRAAVDWSLSSAGDAELSVNLSAQTPTALFGFSVSRAWLVGGLARAEAEPAVNPRARALALFALGDLDAQMARWASAQDCFNKSLALYQALGSQRDCAMLLGRLGWLARERGDAATARQRMAESLALWRELGEQDAAVGMLTTLGDVAVMQGDSAEAGRMLQEALAFHRGKEDWGGVAWTLNHLGHVARMQGQYPAARQYYEESARLFFEPTDTATNINVAFDDYGLGETALAEDRAALALRHFREALRPFRFHDARLQMTWCLAGMAGVFFLEEEPQRAVRLWGAAEALHQSIGGREAPAAAGTRQRLMAAAREQLGDTAFDDAWAQGVTLTMDQAIAEALADSEMPV